MNHSPRRIFLAAFALIACSFGFAHAQSARIQNQITTEQHAPPTAGRDFWFGIPSNFWGVDNGGKYLRIYISSAKNTTAYVGVGVGGAVAVPVQAYNVSSFAVPFSWEMELSGIAETKAVHVWSNDADLTVYFMSDDFTTLDGSYIIPTIGWGTDYVVAGFGAISEPNGDYPSEFTVAAASDKTVLEITPSCDIRRASGAGKNASIVAYPAGETFIDTLNRGESIQFMSDSATDVTGFDVTGTVIRSSNPVGVIGGSMCTNIPIDYPYCDHVEHMIPPVRTWGTVYYTTNFVQPAGQPGHDYGLYLFVASKAGQTFYRQDYGSGMHVECQLAGQYDLYWDELELAQKFWSDAPFMLVEYINSSSYPDGVNGLGDPAEVVIPSRGQYTKNVVFQTPISAGSQLPYDNYATIILKVGEVTQTTFDGKNLPQYRVQPIDDTFEVFTIPHVAPGVHVVTGDSSGVGVYTYGYGHDEAYAWSGPLGISTYRSPDTVAPKAMIKGACYESFVHLADSGMNPGGIPQSQLTMIRLDSESNMAYFPNLNFLEGIGSDTSDYSMYVLDPTKPAYLQVEAFDVAGNRTTIASTYSPQTASIEPAVQYFGSDSTSSIKYAYDTLVNTGSVPYPFTKLALADGNLGFTLDSGMTPSTLQPGERRVLKISFQPTSSGSTVDGLLFGDSCSTEIAALVGNAGTADFSVSDARWLNESIPAPPAGYIMAVSIHNLSAWPITIDTGWWPDRHFLADDRFPLAVPPTSSVPFHIAYFPDDSSAMIPNRTLGTWTSPQVLASDGKTESIRTDSLIGNAAVASVAPVQSVSASDLQVVNNPFSDKLEIHVSLARDIPATLSVLDVLGRTMATPAADALTEASEYELNTASWPAGTYFVRLEAGSIVRTKRAVKER